MSVDGAAPLLAASVSAPVSTSSSSLVVGRDLGLRLRLKRSHSSRIVDRRARSVGVVCRAGEPPKPSAAASVEMKPPASPRASASRLGVALLLAHARSAPAPGCAASKARRTPRRTAGRNRAPGSASWRRRLVVLLQALGDDEPRLLRRAASPCSAHRARPSRCGRCRTAPARSRTLP